MPRSEERSTGEFDLGGICANYAPSPPRKANGFGGRSAYADAHVPSSPILLSAAARCGWSSPSVPGIDLEAPSSLSGIGAGLGFVESAFDEVGLCVGVALAVVREAGRQLVLQLCIAAGFLRV
jgi:hypothetical protein